MRFQVLLFALVALLAEAQSRSFHAVEAVTLKMEKPFVDKSFSNRYFEFGGDTIIRNDRYIRLTQDKSGQRGYFFSKLPLRLPAFQIEFEFNIHGSGAAIYGDGMALWALKDIPKEGPVFGIQDYFEGLGIFIDTYKNDRPGRAFPYIMAMYGDGKTRYDAEHDGAANEIAGCSARGLHNNEYPSMGRLTYVQDKFLSLELNYKGKNEWEKCFETEAVTLPEHVHVGFSAQTGELASNHDLISSKGWFMRSPPESFQELDQVMNGREPPSFDDHIQSSSGGGGWLWFFFKLVLIGAGLFACYVGYGMYISTQKRKREAYYL